jgi:hypothetical protein
MIGMSVGEKHVSDRILIEAELLQAIQDLVFRGIVEQGINDDDALPSHDGPCAMDLRTQEIEVIGPSPVQHTRFLWRGDGEALHCARPPAARLEPERRDEGKCRPNRCRRRLWPLQHSRQ